VVELGETDPHDVAEQDTAHFTPPGLTSFTTIAVNACGVLSNTVMLLISRDRVIGGGGGSAEAPPQLKLAADTVATRNTPKRRAQFFGDIKPPSQMSEFSLGCPLDGRKKGAPMAPN
jgi:hypothetical protein